MALKDAIEVTTRGIGLLGVDKTSFVIALVVLGIAGWNIYSYLASYIDVPSVGVPPGILGPWKASFQYLTKSERVIREGYDKYASTGGMFKVATFARWIVFVTDPKHIQEIRNASDDVLSFHKASRKNMASKFTMNVHEDDPQFLTPIIRQHLTQRLATILNDVNEEATMAFEENLKVGDDWTRVKIWDAMLEVISKTSNRMFVGLPLCRNKEFLQSCLSYATRLGRTGPVLDMSPRILRPFLALYLLNKPKRLKEIVSFVGPIFEERKKKLQTLGDKWTDKPNDAIQWILEAAQGTPTDTIENMTMMVLVLNFAAIHTTSMSITHALFDLASHPHFIAPIREEIEAVLAKDGGWTKQGITKMRKLDSALKESQRLNGIGSISMTRQVLKPFKFSGSNTVLPVGTFVSVPSSAIHHESGNYENPLEYDAFRFSKMREQEGQASKHQMVSTADDYLAFGHGKHACPGRFFAANELKILIAYIIRNYDFKFEEPYGRRRPDNIHFNSACIPDFKVALILKKLNPIGKCEAT